MTYSVLSHQWVPSRQHALYFTPQQPLNHLAIIPSLHKTPKFTTKKTLPTVKEYPLHQLYVCVPTMSSKSCHYQPLQRLSSEMRPISCVNKWRCVRFSILRRHWWSQLRSQYVDWTLKRCRYVGRTLIYCKHMDRTLKFCKYMDRRSKAANISTVRWSAAIKWPTNEDRARKSQGIIYILIMK